MSEPTTTPAEAAAARRAAAEAKTRAAQIDALLVERRGYVVRGLPGRIAQVDDALRILGAEPAEPAAEQAELRAKGSARPAKVTRRLYASDSATSGEQAAP